MDPNHKSGRASRNAAIPRLARLALRVATTAALAGATVSTGFAANWEVSPEVRGGTRSCALVSAPQPVFDGYQQVQAQIVVNERTVVVRSKSVLDPGFADIGMAVANKPFIQSDRIQDRKRAVFEKQYAKIVRLFKEGREVRVQLRFWPTWPATGTHSVSFSLMGFTKAYGEATKCQ